MRDEGPCKTSALIGLTVLCLLFLSMITPEYKGCADEEGKGFPEGAQRVFTRNGELIVSLSKSSQEKSGIVVAPLESTAHAEEVRAYGVVLQPAGLIELQKSYLQAKARADSAAVKLKAAKQEYDRVKALHAIKNISDKALQAAKTDWEVENIDAQISQKDLRLLESAAEQQWGRTLVGWVSGGSTDLQELFQQRARLIQLTLPPGIHVQPPPQTISIQPPGEQPVTSQLVSPSPMTDPKIQGESFFYMASLQHGISILPGMNITAFVPTGPPVHGTVIASSAVVWRQGKAWAYLQVNPEEFTRRQVSTDNPVQEGYFVTKDFRAGDRIVVKGAQALLSQEFLPKVQEEDTD